MSATSKADLLYLTMKRQQLGLTPPNMHGLTSEDLLPAPPSTDAE